MEQIINIDRMEHAAALFGSFDSNIKIIEDEFNVRVHARDSELKISGDAEGVLKASKVIDSLLNLLNRGEQLSEQNITYCISLVNEGSEEKIETLASDCVCVTSKGKPIKPKTMGQKKYCSAIENNTITIRGYGQDLSGGGDGGDGVPLKGSQPYHSHATRRGGGREAGIFAGRSAKQGRPVSQTAV